MKSEYRRSNINFRAYLNDMTQIYDSTASQTLWTILTQSEVLKGEMAKVKSRLFHSIIGFYPATSPISDGNSRFRDFTLLLICRIDSSDYFPFFEKHVSFELSTDFISRLNPTHFW